MMYSIGTDLHKSVQYIRTALVIINNPQAPTYVDTHTHTHTHTHTVHYGKIFNNNNNNNSLFDRKLTITHLNIFYYNKPVQIIMMCTTFALLDNTNRIQYGCCHEIVINLSTVVVSNPTFSH